MSKISFTSVAEPFDFGAATDLAPAPTLNQEKLNIFFAKSIFDF